MHSCLDRILRNRPSMPRSLVLYHLVHHLGYVGQSCRVHIHEHVGHVHSQRALIAQRWQRIDVQSWHSKFVLRPKSALVQFDQQQAPLSGHLHDNMSQPFLRYSPLAPIRDNCAWTGLLLLPRHPGVVNESSYNSSISQFVNSLQ